MGFFDNMGERPIRSPEWKSHEIIGDIEGDAQLLNFGLMSIGKGRAWIDEVSLDIVSRNTSDAETSAAREAIQQLYTRIDAAFETGNVDDILAMALPDAQTGMAGMKVPFRTALEQVRTELSKGTKFTSRTTVTSIQLLGTEAIVTVQSEASQSAADGRRSYVSTFRDTWTRSSEGWRIKESNPLSSRPVTPPTDAQTAKQVAAALRQHAQPLATVQAGRALDDLAPFGRAVGDARIVALGEATHGTREFFQMKHRLLEYLVKEKGFTVFAIEANWPEALAVDRYIKTGEGDPKAALAGMYFWTWNTQEVLDMIEWMRAYNKAPGVHPTLTFTSFDMQTAGVAINRVLEYLRQASPAEVAGVEVGYAEVQKLGSQRGRVYDDGAKTAAERAETVVKLLDSRREALVKDSSPSAWRDARQAAEIARQAATMRIASKGGGYRDEMMARNVEWLAKEVHPTEKIVLWAHNGHVGFGAEAGFKSMGAWLREKLGAQIYVLGFAFRRGELRAVGVEKGNPTGGPAIQQASPSPEGTGDAVLSATGLPLFFLHLPDVSPTTALGRWLAEPHLFVSAGAFWVRDDPASNFHLQALAKTYDGLIFVEEGHAARGLLFITGTQR